MKSVLLWLWQLPQNIIGFIISRLCAKQYNMFAGVFYYSKDHFFHSAVSLGSYIIVDSDYLFAPALVDTLKHEHGHQLQSLRLGPLYLIVVGLPSLCGNIYSRLFHRSWSSADRLRWYYSQPWEAWADRLGGVER